MFSPPVRKNYNSNGPIIERIKKKTSRSEVPKVKLNKTLETELKNQSFVTEPLPTLYENFNIFNDNIRTTTLERSSKKQNLVGKEAKVEFINSYRNIHRFKNFSVDLQESPVNSYLNKLQQKHLSPVPMGIVKSKGKNKEFEIGMYAMGDDYAEAFSEGIGRIGVKKLNLNNNRLTENGAKIILEKISAEKLIEFDISNNKLRKKNFDQIYCIINTRQTVLKILRLEGLQMKDENCATLCKALKKSFSILEVNFAKNNLEGSKSLSKFIAKTTTLYKLDLHWNNIRGSEAINLARSLGKNKTIKVLDLSWNALNSPLENNCAKELGKTFKINSTLIHVDISHNSLSSKDIEFIGEGLKNNHTLLGLHISGNFGTVDDLGFLSSTNERRPTSAHRFKRILGISRVTNFLSWRPCSNCWLCERWSEVEFVWSAPATDPLYLHLGFEDYEGDLMEKVDGFTYKLKRMCPPGKFYYAFTHDGELKLNPKDLVQMLPEPIECEFQVYEGKKVFLKLNEVNVIESNPKGKDYLALPGELGLEPRHPRKKHMQANKKHEWGIPVSIFKDYKFDNDELLGKCFEYDWNKSKVTKIVKDQYELQKIKTYLSSKYKIIKEIYKYYSSISPQGEIWSIGQMVFTELCNEAKIVDTNFRLSDLDFHMKGALYSEVRNPRSPPNALVRFQFMEILTRIAIDKYYKGGIAVCHSEAVIMLLENNIIPNLSHILADKWRFERYLNEGCDLVLKSNRHLLQNIYGRYSGRKVKPGQKPFMSLSEFEAIIQGTDLITETFTVREIGLAFNLSMMTQVQELDTDRQYQMHFLEFIEAFSRAADMAKVPDPVTKEKPNESTPLSQMLSWTLPRLISLLPLNVQKEYKEKKPEQ